MKKAASLSTYSPTVLLVEDDKTCGRYLREQFHDHTSVGVVLAGDLKTGSRLAREIKFDAIISDLFFEQGTGWPEEEMYDGVDFVSVIQREKRNLPAYFLSFFSGDTALHEKARKKKVTAKAWLQKSFSRPGIAASDDAPWLIIERDLLKSRVLEGIGTNDPVDDLSNEEAAVSLAIRLRRAMKTYIHELSDPELTIKHPIEVICTLDEGLAKAHAPALGLLEDGFGESVQEAIDDLAAVIQKQFEWLTDVNTKAVDYAAVVRDRLLTFVARGDL